MADIAVLQNPDLQAKIVDSVFKTSPTLFLLFTHNPGEWKSTSAEKAIKYKSNGLGGAFSGLQTFDRTKVDTKVRAKYDFYQEEQPIVIDQSEIDRNEAAPALAAASVIKSSVEEAVMEMGERLGTRIFLFGGTDAVTGAPYFIGLRGLVDDGTDLATLANLLRSTYTTFKSPYLATGATLSSSNVSNIPLYFSKASVGVEAPDIFFTTKDLWNTYEGLITQTQFTNPISISTGYATRLGYATNKDSLGANIGFESIFIKGRPLVADDLCPANYLFGVNRDKMRWLGLPSKEEGAKVLTFNGLQEFETPYQGMNEKNLGLSMRQWVMSQNQYGSVADLILQGSFTTWSPRHHFKLKFA